MRTDFNNDADCRAGANAFAQQPITPTENSNLHFQATIIAQDAPPFPAKYSGPNSLINSGQVQETVTADGFYGKRIWKDGELHLDALVWQGFGLSQTLGVEAFPNGDAYKFGTHTPNYTLARLFIRQTYGFGGKQEDIPDDQLTLAGKEDISRLTVTVGRFAVTDIVGLAGIVSGASSQNQKFLEAGGTGILDGDGALTYGPEYVMETYYNHKLSSNINGTLDYQYITNPAFNQDRGPASVYSIRLHTEF